MTHYLEEIRDLLKGFDTDIDELKEKVAYMQGVLDEMKSHNGKVIKVLAGIITALLTALVTVVGYVVTR